ncbi:hypothetical protein [Citrobacter koseri]|uniref:hypothetical protein n=1 Tax=Citrobacter koseri TaxID=545 RepID=UPI004039D500
MKIYWTRKSIPELADLPPKLRKKNFKDAYNAISTHIEYWAGAAFAFIWILFFSEYMITFYQTRIHFRAILSELYVWSVPGSLSGISL